MIIPELLYKSYVTKPDKVALIQEGISISYRELYHKVESVAARLWGLGLRKGDKVCLMLNNNLDYIYCFFALASIGCIIIPMDKNTRNEMVVFVNDSNSKAVIADENAQNFLISELKSMPSLEYVFINNCMIADVDKVLPLQYLYMSSQNTGRDFRGMVSKDDNLCFIYTSGTVKKPKGVMLTHFSLMFNVVELKEALCVQENDIFFNILPFFHCYGLCTNLLLPLYMGATIILHLDYSLRDIIEKAEAGKATVMSCVPVMLEKLKVLILERPELTITKYISSGAPLPFSLVKYYKENLNIDIINAYGSSETNTIAVNHDCYNSLKNSVGRVLPSLTVKIIDEENREVPFGEEGEIVLKTPKLMKGYYNLPEETKAVLENGWFYTGDVGYITEERELFITGRKKDMFCVAGKKVYRHDVEEVLMSSGFFNDVYINSVSSIERGERIIANVILKAERASQISKEDILKYCRKMMAPHKVPKEIIFCNELDKRRSWKVNI